ncbi:hypothetical protein [Shimia sediminis]|uniref:hypothetical protein n=1 Tax=Shimia sediminis TaxID=2497945 RepID=UPI000F8DF377|nr:hypothetical protein [Shimia sediminis]
MIFSSNGAKFYMCTTAQTSEPDQSGYEALSWVECKELESIGPLGDSSNEIAFAALSDGRTRRLKGTRDAGTLEVVFGADYADAGQIGLIAAEKTPDDYAFKVEFDDAPTGGTPSARYCLAKVGAANEAPESADNVLRLNATLWVQTAYTRVDAAEA